MGWRGRDRNVAEPRCRGSEGARQSKGQGPKRRGKPHTPTPLPRPPRCSALSRATPRSRPSLPHMRRIRAAAAAEGGPGKEGQALNPRRWRGPDLRCEGLCQDRAFNCMGASRVSRHQNTRPDNGVDLLLTVLGRSVVGAILFVVNKQGVTMRRAHRPNHYMLEGTCAARPVRAASCSSNSNRARCTKEERRRKSLLATTETSSMGFRKP